VHTGHLILANYFTEHGDLDEVWFVLTPHNPHKKKKNLLPDHHRLYMLRLALEPYEKFKVSTVEFDLPQPNYTVVTLAHLKDMFPGKDFVLLMGQDNLESLPRWKNYEQIIENHDIYVYPRRYATKNPELLNHPHVHFFEKAPIVEISASQIRKDIAAGKNVRPLLPEAVFHYIDEMNFYKNPVSVEKK